MLNKLNINKNEILNGGIADIENKIIELYPSQNDISAGPGAMSCLVAICTLALVRAALHYGERLLTHDQTFRTQ